MRIIGTVVFVLIAGISSSADAQSGLRPSCAEIGALDTNEINTLALQITVECLESVENETILELEKTDLNPIPMWHTVESVICDKVPTINKCRVSRTNIIESCLAPDQQKYFIIMSTFFISLFQFILCNLHELGKDPLLTISQTSECVSNTRFHTKYHVCSHNVLPEDSAYTSSPTNNMADFEINLLDTVFEKLNFNSEACSIAQHFEQCLISEANRLCNDDALSTMLAFANYVNKKSTICNIPTLTSVASPGIIVNVLLLSIAVIAMCL